MHTVVECVCCDEIPQTLSRGRVDGVQVGRIGLHPGFLSVCLNLWFLITNCTLQLPLLSSSHAGLLAKASLGLGGMYLKWIKCHYYELSDLATMNERIVLATAE